MWGADNMGLNRLKRKKIIQFLIDLLCITAGAIVLAAGMNMFMVPNMLAPGGISGLGVFFYHLFNIPVGLTIVVLNIPLFVSGFIVLGPRIVIHSIIGTLLFSLAVEITAPILPMATGDMLLASV